MMRWFMVGFLGPVIFMSPFTVWGQTVEPLNAGFVSGIWYSRAPFFAGDVTRIYSALQNQSGFDLIGKVRFYDGNKIIGETEFSVLAGRVIEKWVDWRVTEGDHVLYVRIVEPKKSEPGKAPEPVTLRFDATTSDTQFADLDTDGDRIGDREDADDDNDGVPDVLEIARGADPLKKGTVGDGVPDGRNAASSGAKATSPSEAAVSFSTDGPPDKKVGEKEGIIARMHTAAERLQAKIVAEKKRATGKSERTESEGGPAPKSGARGVRVVVERGIGYYAYQAALSAAGFVLGSPVALYALGGFVGFSLIRRLIRRWNAPLE